MLGIYKCSIQLPEGRTRVYYTLSTSNQCALNKLDKLRSKLLWRYGRITGEITRLQLNMCK